MDKGGNSRMDQFSGTLDVKRKSFTRKQLLDAFEYAMLKSSAIESSGNLKKILMLLDISKSTFYRRLKTLKLQRIDNYPYIISK